MGLYANMTLVMEDQPLPQKNLVGHNVYKFINYQGGKNQDYLLSNFGNVHETPITLDFISNRTVENKGVKPCKCGAQF